jgi:putative transposase
LSQNEIVHRKTFRYQIYPTCAQERKMIHTLRECRWLYNRLLEERRDTYDDRSTGNGISLYSQINRFAAPKRENPALRKVHSQVLQNVALRIDLAFKAFFRRVAEAGQKPGYPRFRGANRYDSFTYPQSGFRVHGNNQVFLSKIGHVKAVIHRPLEGRIKTATVRKTATGKWFVCFCCEVEPKPLPESVEAVGVDVGLKSFAATSDGESVPAPRFFRKEERELARCQRRLSEVKKATKERAHRKRVVAKVHERIANKRKDFAHQQSRKLVNRYGFIAVEDLSVNRMNKNRRLSKSIMDAAWSDFTQKLLYKAEDAGREVVKVNPAYTSQDCSCCGHRLLFMPLSVRRYECPNCGLALDRDHNAALNILSLGMQTREHPAPRSPVL